MPDHALSPRTRSARKTQPRVLLVDRLTSIGITAGGLLVIVCVLGILVYLTAVALPLFGGAQISTHRALPVSGAATAQPLAVLTDEYRMLGLVLTADGQIELFSTADGARLEQRELWPRTEVASLFSRDERSGRFALALPDGRLRFGSLGFSSEFVRDEANVALGAALEPGRSSKVEGGILERTAQGELRRIAVATTLEETIQLDGQPAPAVLIDYRSAAEVAVLALWLTDGRLLRAEIGGNRNFLTGEVDQTLRLDPVGIPEDLASRGQPGFLRIGSRGDELYIAWKDGTAGRFDLRDPSAPVLIERVDLTPDAAELTALVWMLGERSLLAGDSLGGLRAWSRVPIEDAEGAPPGLFPADGFHVVTLADLGRGKGAVTALAVSGRDKTLAVGRTDGSIELRHLTSGQRLAALTIEPAEPIAALQISPKNDGLLAYGAGGRVHVWEMKSPHPETTLRSLFLPVWYEGLPRPLHVWQSSSGSDDFEPKLGLIPLVFGTLKATLYSMLFAIPVAVGAALYSSEFLDPRLRGTIKTTVELMASLPSVVLGFLAALVLAPLVESAVLAVLTAFGLLPLAALAAGYLVQLAPATLQARLRGRLALAGLLLVLLLAAGLARPLAGGLEHLLFAGDFKAWLDGQAGSGRAGLGLVLWPLCLIGLLIADRTLVVPMLSRSGWSRRRTGWIELTKFAAILLLSIGLAALLAAVGFAAGVDPRGSLLGTYVQRNALVVGFVMGFAVIPILFTLSEDALNAVPQSLRSASLGCGATRWQTATRVVLPVALPGIFSALMVALGRAVGETMIVLMAAGNTPVLDLNLFSGLRTLSANIAVELPEAVRDGTLYRVLFLAALTLFAMTFAFNTAAELIRQRLRKRTAQL